MTRRGVQSVVEKQLVFVSYAGLGMHLSRFQKENTDSFVRWNVSVKAERCTAKTSLTL